MFTARKMGKVFFTNSGSEANDTQVRSTPNTYFLVLISIGINRSNKKRKHY